MITSDLTKSCSFVAAASWIDMVIGNTSSPIWTGASSSSFSDTGNWSSGAAPVSGQVLVFDGTNTTANNDLGGTLSAAGMQFNATAGTFTVSGGSIGLSSRAEQLQSQHADRQSQHGLERRDLARQRLRGHVVSTEI